MIIFPEDIRAVRPIAENVNDFKRLVPYIEEAEKLHLIPSIGIALYNLLKASKSTYAELLNGGTYEFENESKYFAGLKDAIGYLAYSRFLINQNINVTAFGVVSKSGQFSEKIDEATLSRAYKDAEKIGLEYLAQCVEYCKDKEYIDCIKKGRQNTKFKAIG